MVRMLPVASSSIRAIGYDAAAEELWIEYRSAANRYIYFGVPAKVFAELEAAPSKGRYVNLVVKPRYDYAHQPQRRRGTARKRASQR